MPHPRPSQSPFLFFLVKSWIFLGLWAGLFYWGRTQGQLHWELLGLLGALFWQVIAASTLCSSEGPLASRLREVFPGDERLKAENWGLFRGLGWFLILWSPIGMALLLIPLVLKGEPPSQKERRGSAPFFYSSPWVLTSALSLLTILLSGQLLLTPRSLLPASTLQPHPKEFVDQRKWTLLVDPITLNALQILSEAADSLQLAARMLVHSEPSSPTETEKTWGELVTYHSALHEESRHSKTQPPRGSLILLRIHSELMRRVLESYRNKTSLSSPIGENTPEKSQFLHRLISALDSSLKIHETESSQPTSLRRSNPIFFVLPPASIPTLSIAIFERVLEARVLSQSAQQLASLLALAQDLNFHLPLDEQPILDFRINEFRKRFENTSGGQLLRATGSTGAGKLLKQALEL